MENFKETVRKIAKTGAKTRGDLLIMAEDYVTSIGEKESFPKIKEKMSEYGSDFGVDKKLKLIRI